MLKFHEGQCTIIETVSSCFSLLVLWPPHKCAAICPEGCSCVSVSMLLEAVYIYVYIYCFPNLSSVIQAQAAPSVVLSSQLNLLLCYQLPYQQN